MANPTTLPGDLNVPGNLRVDGEVLPKLTRSEVSAIEEREKALPFSIWRTWDSFETNLPGTPAADDLGLVGGTFGTNHPSIQSVDFGGTTTLAYARAVIPIPEDYVAGQDFKIRFYGGAHTTVADTTMTLDIEVYRCDEDRTISGDLAAAASANNINALAYTDIDFTITATTLDPGELLDVRISITGDDSGDAGADIRAVIGSVKLVYNGR